MDSIYQKKSFFSHINLLFKMIAKKDPLDRLSIKNQAKDYLRLLRKNDSNLWNLHDRLNSIKKNE